MGGRSWIPWFVGALMLAPSAYAGPLDLDDDEPTKKAPESAGSEAFTMPAANTREA
jgi:hypothetical protein